MSSFSISQRVGMFLILVLLSSCTSHHLQDSHVPVQQSFSFAWSVPNHVDDLTLLREKLQVEHIECFSIVADLHTPSFALSLKDFNRARAAAVKLIQANALTVVIETDTNGWGYEIWKDGRKAGEEYF